MHLLRLSRSAIDRGISYGKDYTITAPTTTTPLKHTDKGQAAQPTQIEQT